jgi:hypothetical protein
MKKGSVAIFAMLIGGMIYLIWRPESLLMFAWAEVLGLLHMVDALREFGNEYLPNPPAWFLNSLPHALWMFCGIVLLETVWRKESIRWFLFWTIGLITVSLFSELGQISGLLPGTYDFGDIAGMLVASIAGYAVTIGANINQGEENNENGYY